MGESWTPPPLRIRQWVFYVKTVYRFQKYETLEIFKAPVQLIYADEDKKLHYNENAVRELMEVDHEVNVIAIVGLYRTGKSLLLNRLARETKGI